MMAKMRAHLNAYHDAIMKISHIFSAFLLLTIPVSEKLMASQIQGVACPMVGDHYIKFPDHFMQYEDDQAPSINTITCGSEPNSVNIEASLPYEERANGVNGTIEKEHNLQITLKPLSPASSRPIKTTLKSIYNPKNYADAKSTPFPKVVVENGLTYVKGRPAEGGTDRVDFYLKPDKKGNTDLAIYCYLSDGLPDAKSCLMGYADKEYELDVVVKIDESEVRDYKNIRQSVSEIIDSIIEKKDEARKDVSFPMRQAPDHIGA
jgi:hypothetical protein